MDADEARVTRVTGMDADDARVTRVRCYADVAEAAARVNTSSSYRRILIARAVIAVADEEQIELRAEVERLRAELERLRSGRDLVQRALAETLAHVETAEAGLADIRRRLILASADTPDSADAASVSAANGEPTAEGTKVPDGGAHGR